MSSSHIRFQDEEYALSDSEDEYTAQEKDVLKKALSKQTEHSDSEDEVYGVHSDSSSNIALSDVEEQDDDDLPNIRAWGKDKRHYYSTDYVDPDYGGYQGKDATLADLEEEEAKNLQAQLLQQLDDDDFALDFVGEEIVDDKKPSEELVKTDVSKLTKRQKIDLLLKESPEFFSLAEDFKSKMNLAQDSLRPIIDLQKNEKLLKSEAMDFVHSFYAISLNYCNNIAMYLVLKSSRVNVQNHPVIKRLFQYRQLLAQLHPIFKGTIKPQIDLLLKQHKNDDDSKANGRRTLKLLTKSVQPILKEVVAKKKVKISDEEIKDRTVKFNPVVEEKTIDNELDDNTKGDLRRSITYQIAKNKGLTPHRNKLQRNPRVKHRNKYRKAKIRRKGAVREVRTEKSRYGGELSGIKASVTKSIKIKS